MSDKRKYPKAFYDDGLGDILEWIDDEILVHADAKKDRASTKEGREGSSKKDKRGADNSSASGSKKQPRRQAELYGDNDLDELPQKESSKKARLAVDLDEEGDEVVEKVEKKLDDRVRGLVNRLAAPTMPFVASEFEKLYSTNSRTAVNQSLFTNIDSSLIQKSAVAKRKIAAELMLLVSYLNHKVSNNIGASLVHHLIRRFENLYSRAAGDDDKRLENITFCLANLYIIGLIGAQVMFELTKRICSSEDFRPKSVELLLIVLKNIGFQLRKDDPSLMRQLILMSHDQCKILKQSSELESRIEFMMEALGAIKNNNISKIGNYGCDIDRDTIESTLKSLIKRQRLPESLASATYNDILNSANFHLLELRVDELKGGEGATNDCQAAADNAITFVGTKREQKLCKALGLNKPAEKTIFNALIKVTDANEASTTLIGFGLNYCSDVMIVCLQVAIFEKTYNPFYYNVINSLCKYNRKYKMAAKFALQDKIRALSGMPKQRVAVFRRLCFELVQNDAVPVTVLKSVEWASLDESTKDFLSYMLTSISELPEEQRLRIMLKADKRSTFAGAMRTFANCFLGDIDLFH